MKRLLVAAASLVALAALFGCSSRPVSAPEELDTPTSAATPASAGAGAQPAPVFCTRREVHSLVAAFVEAFNEGDLEALDRLFAHEGFQWYSTSAPGAGLHTLVSDRSTLIPYFAERHALGETLNLRWFRFHGNSGGYGHFEYRLDRAADDLSMTRFAGKGAVACLKRPLAIAVWSMGAA